MKSDPSVSIPSGLDASRALFIQELNRNHEELVRLVSDPAVADALGAVRKILHMIKGAAGFFGMKLLDETVRSTQKQIDEANLTGKDNEKEALRSLIEPLLNQIRAESGI